MIQLLIIFASCLVLILHAKLTENKPKLTYRDFCIFIFCVATPFVVIIDFLTSLI